MDKETAKKFEKDLATLLERYGMKKKDSELDYTSLNEILKIKYLNN